MQPTLGQRLVVQSAVVAVIDHRDRTVSTTKIVDDFKAFVIEVPVELDAPDILLPAVACPLTIALAREGDATPMKSWTCTPAVPLGRSCRVSVRPSLVGVFPPAEGAYRLEITVGGRALPPWHFTLRTRAAIREETITRVLASVELANLRLMVRRDREPLATDTVFASDELVGPAFTVNATGCSDDVSSVRLDAEMVLERNDGVEVRRRSFALSIRDGANVFDGVRSLEPALHGPLAPPPIDSG